MMPWFPQYGKIWKSFGILEINSRALKRFGIL
jgi:hypothetical protein